VVVAVDTSGDEADDGSAEGGGDGSATGAAMTDAVRALRARFAAGLHATR
jgi:hypothetical protein